jgi:predicted transport protein
MQLFNLSPSKNLNNIKENPFKLEREIQQVFESNLFNLMGLVLVKSEFTIKNKRIDTLAYDPQSKAFIIIEYKRNKNISVIDQGFTYLGLMLENKADFIIEYNETRKSSLKRNEIDWSQTRVVFVSTSFTENQRSATNFKDIAIELWEIKRYENNLVSVNQIKKSKSSESIKPLASSNKELQAVTEQIKVYTEDDHLKDKSDDIRELYEGYKEAILNLADDIEVEPKKVYIAFKKNKNIADISILNKGIKIFINLPKGALDDPKELMRDVSKTGHFGNGDYEILVTDDKNLEYLMSLVKQAINGN